MKMFLKTKIKPISHKENVMTEKDGSVKLINGKEIKWYDLIFASEDSAGQIRCTKQVVDTYTPLEDVLATFEYDSEHKTVKLRLVEIAPL